MLTRHVVEAGKLPRKPGPKRAAVPHDPACYKDLFRSQSASQLDSESTEGARSPVT
jgi:hypothetical protein